MITTFLKKMKTEFFFEDSSVTKCTFLYVDVMKKFLKIYAGYGRSHAVHIKRGILTQPSFCNMKYNSVTAAAEFILH